MPWAFLGGAKVVAVEAEDGQASGGVFGGAKLFVGVAGDAMFRAEEGHDRHAGAWRGR